MATDSHLRRKAIASLIALAVLTGFGLRGKAYLQADRQEGAPPTTIVEPSHSAPGATPSAEPAARGEHEEAAHEPASAWPDPFQLANFALIVAAIGYLGKKYVGPLLNHRAQAIREDMGRSAQALEEATQRLASVEDKLRRLDAEIDTLRRAATEEAAAEQARIAEQAKSDARKITLIAQQEIAAATKSALQELKAYTAELAVGLAERKIRDSLSPQAEKIIFHSFLEQLNHRPGEQSSRSPTGDSGEASGKGFPTKPRGGA